MKMKEPEEMQLALLNMVSDISGIDLETVSAYIEDIQSNAYLEGKKDGYTEDAQETTGEHDMKFMITYKAKCGTIMVFTDYGFAPLGLFPPRLCTTKEADAVTSAVETILVYEANFTISDTQRLCFRQEAVV